MKSRRALNARQQNRRVFLLTTGATAATLLAGNLPFAALAQSGAKL